jgi:hypothetical protein
MVNVHSDGSTSTEATEAVLTVTTAVSAAPEVSAAITSYVPISTDL